MPDIEVEKEFENVKERRSGGITQTIKNIPPLTFILIVGMIALFFFMIKDSSFQNNKQLIIIALAIIALVFFFQKKADATGLISEEVAKKIAVETIENKKEEFHISGDTDISPTNFCTLQYKQGEPLKWHVGIKVENRDGKIDYWRVVIHPYDGIVIGVVDEPTGFSGRDDEVRDVVVVFPDYISEV